MRSAVDATLLALLSVREEPLPPLDAQQWTTLTREAVRHGVAPLVHARLQRTAVSAPDGVQRTLKACQLRTGLENLRLLTRIADVLRQWRQHGIDAIVLKGAYLAQAVYDNPAQRSMGDADLLVRRADLARASALLLANGWREGTATLWTRPDGGGHQLPTFTQGGAMLELHWGIEDDDCPFAIDSDGLWQRAVPASVGGAPALALAPEDLLLHLALHAAYGHGWLQFESGLRPLVDITTCLRHFGDRLDWNVLVQRAHTWRVRPSVWLTLMLVRDLLHAGVPTVALDRLAPTGADQVRVDAAAELVLGHHYRDLAAQLPVLARSWLTKRWHRLPRAARWRSHALPRAEVLARAYPSLRSAPMEPLRYAAYWADLLSDVTRLLLRREARTMRAMERSRVSLIHWLELG